MINSGFWPFFLAKVNASEWEEIVEREKLIVGVKNNLRPMGYQDEDGNLQGFEIDIAKRLAEELLGDVNAIEFKAIDNSQRLQVVIDDQVDLTIASVTVTPSRQRIVNFSPYYHFDTIGIVSKKDKLELLFDVSSSKIAVLENSATIDQVKSNLPKVNLIGVKSYQEALAFLESGKADAFAGNLTVLTGWVEEYPEYVIHSRRFAGYPLAVVMPKGLQYQELRDKVNDAIARWKEEGWIDDRAKFWGLN